VARNRFVCSSCGAKTPIQAFCQQCGQPTPVCTPDERILWEMGQWESSRARQGKPVRTVSLPLRTDPNAPAPVYEPPASTRRQVQPLPAEQPRTAPPAPAQPTMPAQPMKPAARTPVEQRPHPDSPPDDPRPAAPRSVPTEPRKRNERPAGPQIAAAAAASSTAHALDLNVTHDVAEAPTKRQIDKSAALQRIIRNIPRHAPSRTPVDDSIVPEPADQFAKRAALEEAARLAAEMEEQARLAAEQEERERQEYLERVMREAEERARAEAEERERVQVEEKARLEALEQARLDAERKAQEAEERARAAEEQARLAEEQAKIAEEERARRAAEEKARFEAEERVRTEALEQAKTEAEEEARREAEERARLEAEEKARLEAAREAMKEAEARQREAERIRREAEAEAEAAQRAAEKEAKRLAREQAQNQKEAEKTAKKDSKKAAAAAAKAAQQVETHRQEVTGEAKPHRKSRLDKRYDRQVAALGLLEAETVTIMADGRSGVRRATMFITRYRVAIVGRSRRRTMVRWIPLEEVTKIETAWRGAPTLIVNAPIEVLPFKQRAKSTLQQLLRLVQSEVREARAGGGRRHSADLMQDWNDRMNDMLGSSAGRFRLWIRRHPWFTLVWLASIVPIAYFVARSRI